MTIAVVALGVLLFGGLVWFLASEFGGKKEPAQERSVTATIPDGEAQKMTDSKTSLSKVQEIATAQGISIFDVLSSPEELTSAGLKSGIRDKLGAFAVLIFELMGLAPNLAMDDLVRTVLEKTGYMEALEKSEKTEDRSRVNNLKEFIQMARDFMTTEPEPTLENFLAQISLVSDIDTADLATDRVTLMTLHSAKGLEFPVVFIVGMDEGIFPHTRSFYDDRQMEEERRACYVGITRAQEKLYLTHAKNRALYGNLSMYDRSRFLDEIPPECIRECEQTISEHTGERSVLKNATSAYAATHLGGLSPTKAPVTSMAEVTPPQPTVRPNLSAKWKLGDKVRHKKWGVGTIVSLKGED